MHERKFHIKKKGRVYEFSDKEKVNITDFWGKRSSFSMQDVGRKMIFPYYLRNLHDVLRNEKVIFQSSREKKQ